MLHPHAPCYFISENIEPLYMLDVELHDALVLPYGNTFAVRKTSSVNISIFVCVVSCSQSKDN